MTDKENSLKIDSQIKKKELEKYLQELQENIVKKELELQKISNLLLSSTEKLNGLNDQILDSRQ